ncbi:MAG: bifunctional 4-hydroxy-2-oxoglutarate aldolase/2-dehydro-3-deoxy-phosphogluconate aldolase [Aestuariivirgaceae bacterium]
MPPAQHNAEIRKICQLAPVIPVLVVDTASHAVPLAQALVAGGLPVLEVTLRTSAALEVIRQMSGVPGGIVGAGTLLTTTDVVAAKAAGAQFGVSPGATDALIAACKDNDLPLLAGVSTVSEAMQLLERGYDIAKFFPAETSGGVPFLKALAGPLPNMHFCPTGGVNPDNVTEYLSLPNVLCAGGSWLAPKSLLATENWGEIERLAREAAQLLP